MCYVLRTGRRCRCRFLSQLSRCKNAPKTRLLEYARNPRHNVQTDTSLVLDHTYQWGPSVSTDFSILNNSPSPTPELQYTRDGTSQYVHSKCTLACSNKSGSWQESLQFKEKKGSKPDMRLRWCGCIMIQTGSYGGVHIFVQQGERLSEMNAISFWVFIVCHNEETGNTTQMVFGVWVCVCVCVRGCGRHVAVDYAKRVFLMAVHSLTFGQTSCEYMSSSRWSQDNLTRFLVIILPAEENMRSGAAEVAGTARTFLPKRTIHGTTEEARLNSVRGFLCDGIACRCILHKAISSSAMPELDLLRGREEALGSGLYRRKPALLLLWNFVGLSCFFLARNVCTTSSSHLLLVRRNWHLSWYPVCTSY